MKKKNGISKKKIETKKAASLAIADRVAELQIVHHASIIKVPSIKAKDSQVITVGEGDLPSTDPVYADDFFIEGYASTEDLDRGNDITQADAFSKSIKDFMSKNPILLYNHDMDEPIGKVIEATIEKGKGLFVKAFISATEMDIRKKIMEGILKAFSFGYKVKKYQIEKQDMSAPYPSGVRRLLELELIEVSVVSIPMNQNALFSMAKAIEMGTDLIYKNTAVEEMERKLVAMEKRIDAIGGNIKGGGGTDSKSVVPFKSFPLADAGAEWGFSSIDGNRLLGDNGDDWKTFEEAHAWYDESNTAKKSSYKLPHHKYDGDVIKTYPRGVFAAMAALMGARGGTMIPEAEIQGTYDHLAKHYKELEKEPPVLKEYSAGEIKVIEEGKENNENNKKGEVADENKAGRVISDANMQKLMAAMDAMNGAMATMKELMDAAMASAMSSANNQSGKTVEINRIQIVKRVVNN